MEQENNGSIISRRFDDIVIHPLVKVFGGIKAQITMLVISIGLFFSAFYTSFWLTELHPVIFLSLLILYFISLRLSKKSGDGGARFDLLYHGLNSVVYGLLGFVVFQYFSSSQWYLFVVLIFLSYSLNAFFYYYQFKANQYPAVKFSFADIFILMLSILFMSLHPAVKDLIERPLIQSYSLVDFTLVLLMVGMLVQFVRLIKSVPHLTYGIWLFIAGLSIIAAFGYYLFVPVQLAVALTLYGGWYITKLKVAVLVDGVERSTGLFTPIMVAVSYFMESLSATNTFIIISAYMLFSLLLLLYKSLKALKTG